MTPDYRYRTRILGVLALVVMAVAMSMLAGCCVGRAVDTRLGPIGLPINEPGACHEDMPCWDCETMGNRICGPVES